jgi:DNA-binding response OmpR family regulator
MKILVIEDEKSVANLIAEALQDSLSTVDIANDGENAIYMFQTNTYDLVLLDYNLPIKNGEEVLEEIKKENKNVPVIAITVEMSQEIKNRLFELGVDDYITKPFIFDDLISRVEAVSRRPHKVAGKVYKIDDLHVDIERHRVRRGKNNIYLTFKELMLLEFFLKNEGRILSRTILMENVWDFNADPFSNTIESHILKLRKKINPNKDKGDLIHTVKGRGYKLDLNKW